MCLKLILIFKHNIFVENSNHLTSIYALCVTIIFVVLVLKIQIFIFKIYIFENHYFQNRPQILNEGLIEHKSYL